MPSRDYIKKELAKELTVRDDIAATLSDHSENGLIPQFVKKVNEMHEEKDIRHKVRNIVGASGKNYGKGVYLDSTLLDGLTDTERVEMVKEYLKELGGSVFTAYDKNNKAVDIHLVESNRKFKNEKGKKIPVNQHLKNYLQNPIKQEAIALVDELILTANYSTSDAAKHKHDWLDNNGKNPWEVWITYLQDKENTVWKANLQIANSVNGEKVLYEVHPIEKVEGVEKIDTAPTVNRIPQPTENVNTLSENSSEDIRHKARATSTTPAYISPTASNIVTDIDSGYDYTLGDKIATATTSAQIAFTNAQAGIEKVGKKYGVDNIEAMVQAARVSSNQAQQMIAGNQYRIGSSRVHMAFSSSFR